MAVSVIASLGVCLLFAVTNGQTGTGTKVPSCSDSNNMDYIPDPNFGQLFKRCSGGQESVYCCGDNLLFNTDINGCDFPASAICLYWPCNAETFGKNYSHLCHENHYMCTKVGFVLLTCPSEEYFSLADGHCKPGVGVDHELCQRRNGTNTGPKECNNFADIHGDKCKYRTQTGNNTYEEDRPCPSSTAFNSTSCGCDILTTDCPKPTVPSNCKLPDLMCRPSFEMTFDEFTETGAPKVFCQKNNAYLNAAVEGNDVQYSAGVANFRNNEDTAGKPYLYVFYYNDNQLIPQIGMCATIKPDSPTTEPINLFINNYFGSCKPTLEITATLAGSTFTMNVMVTGMTKHSRTNTTFATGTLSASLTVGAGSYCEMCLLFDGKLHTKMTDKGVDGMTKGTPVLTHGEQSLGSTIATNRCGLLICEGLQGSLQAVSINEGCRNSTKFFEA